MVGFLIVLLAAALVLSGVAALILVLGLRRDVGRLHDETARLRALVERPGSPGLARPPAPPAPGPGPAASHPGDSSPAPPRPRTALRARKTPARSAAPGLDLEAIIGGRWLTWIGVLAIFFGSAFFLAFDLGEHALAGVGQLLVGILVGVVFIGTGVMLSRREPSVLGQGLLGGGVALLFLAAYAGYGFHGLVPAMVVYPFLLGVAAIGATLALRLDSPAVAGLTLVGALLTPALLQGAGNPMHALFPYLIAVNAGAAIAGSRRHWPFLVLASFAGTAALLTDWWGHFYEPGLRGLIIGAVAILWLLFAVTPFAARATGRFWSLARGFVIVVNGIAFAVFIHEVLAPDLVELRGLALALLALAYVTGSRLASRRGARPATLLTYYTGVALAVIAVPIQFDAAATTLAWGLLGFVLYTAGVQLPSTSHRLAGLAVFVLALGRVLTFDTAAVVTAPPETPITNGGFLSGLVVIGLVATSARLLARSAALAGRSERRLITPITIVAATVLLWRISAESIGWFRAREIAAATPGALQLASNLTLSLIWAIYAGILVGAGFAVRFRAIRLLGVAVLGVLVIKVFVVDMQELESGYRIASFVGVGVLLLAISVLYQKGRRE